MCFVVLILRETSMKGDGNMYNTPQTVAFGLYFFGGLLSSYLFLKVRLRLFVIILPLIWWGIVSLLFRFQLTNEMLLDSLIVYVFISFVLYLKAVFNRKITPPPFVHRE